MRKKIIYLLTGLCLGTTTLAGQIKVDSSNYPHSRFVRRAINTMKVHRDEPLIFNFSFEANKYGRYIQTNVCDSIENKMGKVDSVYSFEVNVYYDNWSKDYEKKQAQLHKDITHLFFVLNSCVPLGRMRFLGVNFTKKKEGESYPSDIELVVSKLECTRDDFYWKYESSVSNPDEEWKIYTLNTDRTEIIPYTRKSITIRRKRGDVQ